MNEINILSIDTATKYCSVAVYSKSELSKVCRESKKHSSNLIGLIQNVLVDRNLKLNDLQMVIVNTGPGSFTGVRTGIGVAQGIAYGLRIPLCGIDSLSILATGAGKKGLVVPIMDARMKQVYTGIYKVENNCSDILSPYVTNPDDIQIMNQQEFTVVGDGWQLYQELFQSILGKGAQFQESAVYPDAALAISAYLYYGLGNPASPLEISATYIRDNVVQSKFAEDMKT
ncbi:MAG: tRNA (adenosine(37)-N6)-threonylcarbamoyltransferase complex dimerization subunit type 1 TsaB [Gammaproteobacteria bacterium]|nr:tRNA (adenosine(37)-N6)-threonylcarbamoyltransferase complex dimerization subunit type 1 TsaB [Gammaproteobacteria bacterium]MCY4218528.1 tRNA (adenosine(37)-N6)-threonylcarbamoyltransferase complex dimerization subunit type 1 TsaB [Gammaproteobacteria bacterium]